MNTAALTTDAPIRISLIKTIMFMVVCIHTLFFYLYLSSNLGNLGFGDLGIYQIQFLNIIKYNGLQNSTDLGFYYLMMLYGEYLNFELFVTTCFFVFYLSLIKPFYYLSEAKLLVVILFLMIFYYPMYQSLSSLVLRQGMGFAFLMFSGFYFNSHRFLISTLKISLAALFHLSLLFYIPVIAVNRMISSLKLLVFFWCGIVVLYVLEIPNAFVDLLPGELSGMVRAFNMVNDDYVVGFKPLKHVPINISVKSGDCLLLQGESGIGKSSIVYAIAGLIDYDGSIQLNGIEVRDIQVETLRDSMTVSMQDDHLFASSILENLRLANPSATFAEIVKALSAVELDHLIDVLPDGLDTHIGPFGQNFSGGELQRMRLARIFLRRTPLYILDEPLGHLDEDLAKRIIQRLLVHMTGATVVVISHEDIAGVEDRFLIASAV